MLANAKEFNGNDPGIYKLNSKNTQSRIIMLPESYFILSFFLVNLF